MNNLIIIFIKKLIFINIKFMKLNMEEDLLIENNIENITEPQDYKKINISTIKHIVLDYPNDFIDFCKNNNLRPPSINSGRGKCLSAMLQNKYKYWNRDSCDKFVEKFNITTKDSIQMFNKHSQWGIKTNSGIEKGKLYIVYPYSVSNKHKMRKNFKYDGNKDEEINKIKSTIYHDYIDVSNDTWQLGHKNPGSTDNTTTNLILQPPIQSKYRDDYIFIDTLTKIPLPLKLKNMIKNKEIIFTEDQINEYIKLFQSLKI